MLNMKYPKGPVYDPQTETSNHKRKFPWRKGGSRRLQTSPVGSILAKPLTVIPGAERRQTLYNIFNKGSKNGYKPIEREEIIETHTPGGRAMSPLFSQFSKYRQYFRRVATRLPRVASATSGGSDATPGTGATSSSKEDEDESQEVIKTVSATEAEADARLRQLIRASAYSYGGIDVVKLFQHYDRDNSGELDMDEFLSALRRDAKVPRGSVPDEQLRDVFYRVDADNSGTVDTQEFAEWLQLEIVENEEVSLSTQQLLEQRALRTRCKKCFVRFKLPHVVDPPSMQRWSESFQSCLAMCRRVMAIAQKRADHDGRAAISPIRVSRVLLCVKLRQHIHAGTPTCTCTRFHDACAHGGSDEIRLCMRTVQTYTHIHTHGHTHIDTEAHTHVHHTCIRREPFR